MTDFDVVFLNGYKDQSDQLGWHADDSPEMDDNRSIAIISLGAEREIWFRKNGETLIHKLLLENGSVCLMLPGMQDTHQHRIPKANHAVGKRISLTFRGTI
jgi:alkylated DNA repair dioxygenase AlkB